jgi:hypothetical protein
MRQTSRQQLPLSALNLEGARHPRAAELREMSGLLDTMVLVLEAVRDDFVHGRDNLTTSPWLDFVPPPLAAPRYNAWCAHGVIATPCSRRTG